MEKLSVKGNFKGIKLFCLANVPAELFFPHKPDLPHQLSLLHKIC